MKNTMIPAVAIAAALLAENGTIHVCALDESSDVYTEHDFSRTSEISGTQEDEMEYQKAKADAEKKREYLNSVSDQYELAKQNTASAKKVLDEECERVINDSSNELVEAERIAEQAKQKELEATRAKTEAESNVSDAEKQLKEAEEDYQKLLDDLHIPSFAMDELNQKMEETKQEYQDTSNEKQETSNAISALKMELGNQYLNLTALKTNRDLKQDALISAKKELEAKTESYNHLVKQISDIDENYPDISSSIALADQNIKSAQTLMENCQKTLDDYNGRKTIWEKVKSNGVDENNLMYNEDNGYYYKPEDVDSFLSEIYKIIEKNTCDYAIAESDYKEATASLESLTEIQKQREDLLRQSNRCKEESDNALSAVQSADLEYGKADTAYQNLYQKLSDLMDELDRLEQKENCCSTKMESCCNDMNSIQDEINALNKLKELCNDTASRTSFFTNSSQSYADLYKQFFEAKKKKETAKEVLNDASKELAEKKKAEQIASDALKEAEQNTEKAKEKYESARAAVLEIRNDGKLTAEEFSYLNRYLLAYNNAVKNENQLRASYELAKMEYDIAAGLIAPGSELYNRHMKYIESLNAYEKLLTDSSDVPETSIRKPVENTSVASEFRRTSNELMTGVILVSSLIFATYSVLKVKRNRHDHA